MVHVDADQTIDLPEEFADLVRDALLHLYDPAHLQAHPLLTAASTADAGAGARGRFLRQALLDAVETLHPALGVAATSRAWRTYRILELRYVEGHDVTSVMEQVALSKSQYHREHHRALQGVAALLWERWQLDERWSSPGHPVTPERDDDLTRREAESLSPGAAGRIDPVEVARGVGQLLQPLSERRGVELRLALPDGLPDVAGERVALRQVLLTILAHAIGVLEGGAIDVTMSARGRDVEMTIVGPRADRQDGIQLGLDESRPFVAALDGASTYLPPSQQDDHWTVRLSFPVANRPTLLVVDNNADFLRLVELYLAGHDWDVVGATDVDRAYHLAQQRHPQAILLDAVLPGRDGWDLLLDLKQVPSTRDIPVILCSVLDEPDVAISLGAAAYLHKPIDELQLVTALTPFR